MTTTQLVHHFRSKPAAPPRRSSRHHSITTPVSAKVDQSSYQVINAVASARREAGAVGTSPASLIREALDSYFEERLNDPDLDQRMAIATERHEAILAGLKAGEPESNLRSLMPAPIPVGGAGGKERAVTVRVDERTLGLLEGFALIDGTGIADQIRMAVTSYVNPLREDPATARELARIEAANQSLANALGV